jgi:hypothetical protein
VLLSDVCFERYQVAHAVLTLLLSNRGESRDVVAFTLLQHSTRISCGPALGVLQGGSMPLGVIRVLSGQDEQCASHPRLA